MSYYFIVLFILLLGCLLIHKNIVTVSDRLMFAYVFLALFLFSALRKDVGMDYEAYKDMYMNSYNLNEDIKEYGLRYVFVYFNRIGLSYEFIVSIFSLFTLFYAFKFIYKYSSNVMFSVLIFFTVGQFYQNTFNIIRQCLVIYVVLSHLDLVLKHKYLRFIFLLLICSFFIHQSAIFLSILCFGNCRISAWRKLCLLMVIVPISDIFMIFVQNSPYAMYREFERFISDIGMSTYLLFFFSLLLFLYDIVSGEKKRQDILFFNINVLLLAAYILVVLFENSAIKILVMRLTYYFSPILVILIPRFLDAIKKYTHLNFVPLAYAFFVALFVVSLFLKGEINNLVPYKTILM